MRIVFESEYVIGAVAFAAIGWSIVAVAVPLFRATDQRRTLAA